MTSKMASHPVVLSRLVRPMADARGHRSLLFSVRKKLDESEAMYRRVLEIDPVVSADRAAHKRAGLVSGVDCMQLAAGFTLYLASLMGPSG